MSGTEQLKLILGIKGGHDLVYQNAFFGSILGTVASPPQKCMVLSSCTSCGVVPIAHLFCMPLFTNKNINRIESCKEKPANAEIHTKSKTAQKWYSVDFCVCRLFFTRFDSMLDCCLNRDIPSKWARHHKTCRTTPACIFEGGVMGSCRGTSGLGAKHLNEDGTTIIKSDITAMARCEIKLIHLQLYYLQLY